MQDGPAERLTPPPAKPVATEKPADPNLAKKAWGELRTRAQILEAGLMGWHEIRTGNIDDWFKDADPTKREPAGFLKQEDPGKDVTPWKDDDQTKEYLANAQTRAIELAQKGVGEIGADLGIPGNQIVEKTLDEVYAVAEAKGWNVIQGDPKGDETRDYLRNAHEYAKEQQQVVEVREEAEDQAAEVEAAIETAATAGEIAPEMAGLMLGVIKDRGQIKGVIENQANELIKTKEPEKVARGLDLQISGLQYQLVQTHDAIQRAAKKSNNKEIKRLSVDAIGLNAKIKDLQNQRSTGKVMIGDDEIEIQKLGDQSNKVDAFVQKLGIKAKNVEVIVLDEEGETQTIEVTSSLAGLHDIFSAAIANKESRAAFIQNLRQKSGLPEDNIDQIEKYLGSEVFKKGVEKGRNIAVKAGAGVGVLMLLMAWLASKEKQGQAMV